MARGSRPVRRRDGRHPAGVDYTLQSPHQRGERPRGRDLSRESDGDLVRLLAAARPFNGSIIVFGALVVVGTWAVRPLLPRGRVATAGAALLVVAGLGAGIVGLFPEDTVGVAHGVGALLAFVGSAGALAALGIAMNRDPRWAGYEALTSGCGAISTGVLVTSLFRTEYGPLGFGGTERLLLAPALLWLAIVGARLVWKPRLPGPTTHG